MRDRINIDLYKYLFRVPLYTKLCDRKLAKKKNRSKKRQIGDKKKQKVKNFFLNKNNIVYSFY